MYVLNERTSLLYQTGSPFVTEHTWVFLFYISGKYFPEYIKNVPVRMQIIVAEQIQKKKEKRKNHGTIY